MEPAIIIQRNVDKIQNKFFSLEHKHASVCICYCKFEFAEWLLSIIKDTKLVINYDELFFDVCKNGNLHSVKWLFSINQYININNEVFFISCKNTHYNVAQFLLTVNLLDDSLDKIDIPDTVFIDACKNVKFP